MTTSTLSPAGQDGPGPATTAMTPKGRGSARGSGCVIVLHAMPRRITHTRPAVAPAGHDCIVVAPRKALNSIRGLAVIDALT